jgi:hypothetical protein
VDFADAILDIIVSVQALVREWALVLFSMTLAARLLVGLFGVFYESIDESDREVTYFLVEMAIWFMEDLAALIYLSVAGITTKLDFGDFFLTNVCLCALVISNFCNFKTIAKRLPRCASCALLILYAYARFMGVTGVYDGRLGAIYDSRSAPLYAEDSTHSIAYTIVVVTQLCMLLFWCRSLAWKMGQPRQDAALASEELSV